MRPADRQAAGNQHSRSYLKTVILAMVVGMVGLFAGASGLAFDLGGVATLLAAMALLASAVCVIVVAAGCVVLVRHWRESQGKSDLFATAFMRQPPDYSKGWRRGVRPLLGPALRPGDVVLVRTAQEIRRTLVDGRLNGMPFMPEMLACCGRQFTIDRRIDKINDWPGGNKLRRMRNVVSLVGLRCDGSRHGGCDAGCQMLWQDAWLRRLPGASHAASVASEAQVPEAPADFVAELAARSNRRSGHDGAETLRYICQNTELCVASSPMREWDVRQDLRPLFNGNLSLTGWSIAMLTRLFNRVQALRGGVPFPVMAPMLSALPTPTAELGLQPGERVRVRNKLDIGRTLHRYFNRGMWFGEETMRHCNQEYTVVKRVTRLIDERTGELRTMKTPAIALDRATATGEQLRFVPQNEYVFWREIWLERVETAPAAAPRSAGAA